MAAPTYFAEAWARFAAGRTSLDSLVAAEASLGADIAAAKAAQTAARNSVGTAPDADTAFGFELAVRSAIADEQRATEALKSVRSQITQARARLAELRKELDRAGGVPA